MGIRKEGEEKARRFEEVNAKANQSRDKLLTLIPCLRAQPIALRR